jgi:PAS domain S-box-containing protein
MLLEEKMVINNQESYISSSLNPILDAEGNVIAVTGIVRDVTERKKTEKALQESEERFRVIFEGANDGILVADVKTQRFVLANPQMCEMVGYPLEDLLKMSLPDIHPKESLAYVVDQFKRSANKELLLAKDIPLLRSDKQIVYCEVSSKLLEIWKQQCLVGFFRDVTERKKAEKKLDDSYRALEKQLSEISMLQKELENANKLLGQSNVDLENYTYVVSHDLKAPLRAIRSFSAFILEDYNEKLDETGKDYFQRIIDASTRMDALIENLLLLSRVGRKFMEVETVDLNQLLEEIATDLEPTLKKNNGKIVFHNLPKVTIPRTWMKQIFMNLIDNGLKFNKSKTPTVEVTCEDRDTELLFKVSDNGIGVEEKYFDRLFTLFERLHTQEEYPGTGAGLAICKKIVQQFGGRIWIESQVGKGSTFFFTLSKNKNPTLGAS